ncbi:MAG: hypothetical protein AAF602_30605 [Myxococcota bacterium]
MVTADVLAVVFTLGGLFVAAPAFQLVARALWPRVAHQSTLRFARGLGRPFLVGLIVVGPLLVPLGALSVDVPPVRVAGVMWLGILIGLSLAGLTGLSQRVGDTLVETDDPSSALVRGAVALELACLVPFLGWFVLLPSLALMGLGTTVLALVGRLEAP